ncbi:MAG: hypothetical protein NXI01_05460 [Gammaproteobacteria bacterium]|nr:hypothetical protein [Gammaproteobacteria bacterium]
MRQKLDDLRDNCAHLTTEGDRLMDARAAMITATHRELDVKLPQARQALEVANVALSTAEQNQRFWQKSTELNSLKAAKAAQQRIVDTLEKAKILIDANQAADVLRLAEVGVQNGAIVPLWNGIDTNVRAAPDDANVTDADQANFKAMEQHKRQIKDLHAEIKKNTQRIEHCHLMAQGYAADEPWNFPAHWLEQATIIVEQQDFLGFKGEIERRALETKPTPGTGLTGYTVAYGDILKEGEYVRYTLPGTKVLIEHQHSGHVVDRSNHAAAQDPNNNQANMEAIRAAVKMAHLLLLDKAKYPEHKIFLNGPNAYNDQAKRVAAVLLYEAEQMGIPLQMTDIEVTIPAWDNPAKEVAAYRESIGGLLDGAPHITAEFRDKFSAVRDNREFLAGEAVHIQRGRL